MSLENLIKLAEFAEIMGNEDSRAAFRKESDNIYEKAREAFKSVIKYSNTSYEEILSLLDSDEARQGFDAFLLGTFYPVYSLIGEDFIDIYVPIFKFFESITTRIKRLETANNLLSETIAAELAKEN